MDMYKWAQNEVALACEKEREDHDPLYNDDWDYGVACYESALKVFKVACEDGHSGMSIQFVKQIFDKLIEGHPLTPIKDEDFFPQNSTESQWMEDKDFLKTRGLKSSYQCPRMWSLFRDTDIDGNVTYNDVSRVVCQNKWRPSNTYHSGKGDKYVNTLFPIKMPYMPSSNPYKVITDDCLVDPKLGDWDTEAWYEVICPNGDHVPINYFCKYEEVDDDVIEVAITEKEFNQRKELSKKLYEEREKKWREEHPDYVDDNDNCGLTVKDGD